MSQSGRGAPCVPVLLAGGVGSRLWPLSRAARPKQFLAPVGDQTLLRQTLTRLAGIDCGAQPILVGRDEHRFVLAEQLRAAGLDGRILLEPTARGTAPAVAAAACEARRLYGDDARLLVLPTDHTLADDGAFKRAVETALAELEPGQVALFGVAPTRAETGYGYIRADESTASELRPVEQFVEKPDAASAARYVEVGGYYWNSGMFLFRAGDYLAALDRFEPAIARAASAAHAKSAADFDFLRLDAKAYAAGPNRSIDHAVMERTDRAAMIELNAGWNDLGSWQAVARAIDADARGNSVRGDVWLEDADDCVVYSDGRLVAALGTRNQIIVETADAVLVADRGQEQRVGDLVEALKHAERTEASTYPRVYRPWGSYEQVAAGPRFQVKHICVTPGAELSLQKHFHRAEHWVVVSGVARVTRDEDFFDLTENQSTYIPLGAVHRLANPGAEPLDLIEVQSGDYLGEDDIERFDDRYGRLDADEGNVTRIK